MAWDGEAQAFDKCRTWHASTAEQHGCAVQSSFTQNLAASVLGYMNTSFTHPLSKYNKGMHRWCAFSGVL